MRVEIPVAKLSPLGKRFEGPFKIERVVNRFSYQLQDSNGKVIRRYRDNLKPILIQNMEENKAIASALSSSILPHSNSSNVSPNSSRPVLLRRSERRRQPVKRFMMDT